MSTPRLFPLLAIALFTSVPFCNTAKAQNIAIGNASVTEGDAGTVQLDFPISLSQPAMAPISLTWSTSDGSATAGSDFNGVTGGTISIAAGASSAVARVLVQGDIIVEPAETLTAVITLGAGSPGSIVTNQALGRIDNDDAAVLQVTSVTQAEGNASGTMSFSATLSRPVQGTVSVRVTSSDDSASAPADYSPVDQLVQFPSQTTSASFAVLSVGEQVVEPNERFNLTLSELNAPAPVIASVSLSTEAIFGTLTNDDSATISIDSPSVLEGNAGQVSLPFALTLSAPVQGGISLMASTSDGTATATGDDFQSSSALVQFTGLSTTAQSFVVNLVGDQTLEPDETVVVNLSGLITAAGIPTNAVSLSASGLGVIRNDDAVVISIGNAQALESDGGIAFPVVLSARTAIPVSIQYTTQDGTAIAGRDFTETNGTLVVAAGETSQTIVVPITIDAEAESNESFNLILASSNPTAPQVTLNPALATGTILGNGQQQAVPTLGSQGAVLLIMILTTLAGFALRRGARQI